MTRDWGREAHDAAVAHIEACEAWLEQADEHPDGDPSSSASPYCGCQTCQIRETLQAAWPVIEAAIRSGDFDQPGRLS